MRNILSLAVLMVIGFSCQQGLDEIDSNVFGDELASALNLEASSSSAFEDIDLVVEEGVSFSSGAFPSSGRLFGGIRKSWRNGGFGECAVVEKDTVNQTIIIDFGDGCEGRRGRSRSGQIIITFDGDRETVGSFRSMTFENYFVDSMQIEGTRTHTILDIDENGNKTISSKTEGGRITFSDGTFAKRDAETVRFRFRGESLEDSYSTLEGSASGINADGLEYSMSIDNTIIIQGACIASGTGFVPVSGVKSFTNGESQMIIDYGDGTCDNIATVNTDGVSEEIELNGRGKNRRGRG